MPSEARVTTGNDVTFMATDYIDAAYEWFHNSAFIFNRPDKYSGEFTSKLTVMNAQESDEGNYRCNIILGGASAQPTAQLFVCKHCMTLFIYSQPLTYIHFIKNN